MAVLSDTQIATYAYAEGIRDEPTLARAVAVALAESGGNASAHNAKPPDDSYGLWQINMYGSLGPQRRAAFTIASNSQLLDPKTNAHAMYLTSGHGKNWSPWSTFKSNAYLKYMDRGTTAAKAVIAAAPDSGKGGLFDGLKEIVDVPGAIGKGVSAFNANVTRIFSNFALVMVASILLILGVVILIREPLKNAALKTASVAGGNSPIGKTAHVVGKVVK